MRISKLSLIAAMVLGSLVACSSIALAQDAKDGKDAKKGKRGMQTVEERLALMTKELSLTAEQKPKVESLLKETEKKMADVAPEDRRTKGREIRDEQDKKLKEILTADQFSKWETLRDEMRKKKKGEGPAKKD